MRVLKFIAIKTSSIIGEDLTLKTVKEFLETNKADEKVVKYLDTFRADKEVTEELVTTFFNTDRGKEVFNSLADAKVGKALKTQKEKYEADLSDLIETEHKKKFPDESDESKANRKLSGEIEQIKAENKKSKLESMALKLINKLELPFTDIVENLLGEDEDSTTAKISQFGELWNSSVTAAAEKLQAKNNGRKVEDHKDDDKSLEDKLAIAQKNNNLLDVIRLKNLIHAKANKD